MKNLPFYISFFLCLTIAKAQDIPTSKVDSLVNEVIKIFDVPGIAVGIVRDGTIVLAKGYGVESIKTQNPVTANTNFGIASNSKAFTAAALAMLVDEKKLDWNDPVQRYIPEFRMYNDYVSENFTIADLLTHRSGLGLGAGDLMIWPDGHTFTPNDIIANLRYLKPVSAFRTKYDYDNLLYIVAGVVIERVSGLSWADFVTKRFFKPLGMENAAPSLTLLPPKASVIDGHVPIDGKLVVIEKYSNRILDAAGGIYANINDLTKWVNFLLNEGNHEGQQLISTKQLKQLKTPHTLMSVNTRPPYYSLFSAYGLGFRLADVNGKLEVSHTGGLEGTVTQIVMYPQLKLGIIVLTNQQVGAAFQTISNTIKDYYLNIAPQDWLSFYKTNMANNQEEADLITGKVWETVNQNIKDGKKIMHDLEGLYRDNWFGDVDIQKYKDKLIFASQRSPRLSGELIYYKENSYIVKWNDRYFHADAFVHLQKEGEDITGFTMLPISPLTDFSYDFQDLDFKKVK